VNRRRVEPITENPSTQGHTQPRVHQTPTPPLPSKPCSDDPPVFSIYQTDVIYYGDNFPSEPTAERGQDNWRVRLAMARLWVAAINKHGGDAQLVHLPEVGVRGNTHFLMSDLNNLQIADLVSQFLTRKKLN